MILFKHPEKQRELAMIKPRLMQMVLVMRQEAWKRYKDLLVVTDIFRDDPNSPHRYGRAIDIAILHHGGMAGSEELRAWMNQRFPYDRNRPEMQTIPDLRHGTSPHFHIQISG